MQKVDIYSIGDTSHDSFLQDSNGNPRFNILYNYEDRQEELFEIIKRCLYELDLLEVYGDSLNNVTSWETLSNIDCSNLNIEFCIKHIDDDFEIECRLNPLR